MKCSIEFLLFVVVFVNCVEAFSIHRVSRQSEICGYHNGHRKYLELGESGQLSANVSVPSYIQEVTKQFNQTLTMQCTVELVTCPSCVIKLNFNYTNFPSNCENPKRDSAACRCDFIILSEPPYDTQANIVYNCGRLRTYQSKTRSVQIKFVYWNNYTDAFQLEYSSERNSEMITVDDSIDLGDENVEISSPFFPALYPRDYSTEHVINCNVVNCRIRLVFSDFQISRSSNMEFYDTNGERLFVTGATFRPPILITSGARLMIRFYANGGSDFGYKARISFLTDEQAFNPDSKPRTGCGGLVDSVGGAITMMDMVDQSSNETDELFDCIWIVRPPEEYTRKTHVSLKVETFEKMASKSEIIILQGTTSDRPIMERLESLSEKAVSTRTLVVPITAGFYVRFRGKFNSESRLAIVYTAFSYSKCFAGGDFLCENQRCIPLVLQCDGFNQCGDNSDEPESCPAEWARSIVDRRWYSHTPNYYFPKIERFTDVRTTTMALVVSSMSLFFVISCLILTLYRNGNRVREQEELQNQLHTISQLLDGNNNNNNRPEEIIEPPPNYEEPPAYDEIIKVGMDEQITKSKQEKRLARKHRLHRPRRSDPAVSYQSGLLEASAVDDSDVASTSSFGSESPYYTGRNASQDFVPSIDMIEIAEASETTTTVANNETSTKVLEANASTSFSRNSDYDPTLDPIDPLQDSLSANSPRRHLWSNESKFKKSWILFNSDDQNLDKHLSSESSKKYDCADQRDCEEFFTSFPIDRSVNSCFCDSSQLNGAELTINNLECELCKNLILRQQNRRSSMCGDCVEKFYSPKICSTCSGRISFQDLKGSSNQLKSNRNYDSVDQTDLKLCNCFPKFPSQSFSSIHPFEASEVQTLPPINGKSCSYNELVVMQQKVNSSSPPFYSHGCLPSASNSIDEPTDDED